MTREKSPIAKSSSSGFTLIETAIVTAISSLLIVAGMDLINAWMNQEGTAVSQQRLDTIQQALANFETQYNRLPYPASFTAASGPACYGRESNTPLCTAGAVTFPATGRALGSAAGSPGTVPMPPIINNNIVIGALPVRALGLPDSYIADTYGYRYTYAVTESETSTVNPLNPFAGVIEVDDNILNNVLPLASDGITLGTALYVVVDHGSDGKGAYTTSGAGPAIACGTAAKGLDFNNCNHYASGYFSAAPFNKHPGQTWFDDMIVYGTSLSTTTTIAGPLTCSAPIYSTLEFNGITPVRSGTSVGWTETGVDYGWGWSFNYGLLGLVPFTFTFTDQFYFGASPVKPTLPGAITLAPSPTADAYCPGTTYHVVSGGCTQTYNTRNAAPNAGSSVNGPVTNAYGMDITKKTDEQIVQPPLSHPVLNKTTGKQGWECNGSNAKDMYTQAYVVCCKGGS